MAENLKVNAKTKTLTFKKKFNSVIDILDNVNSQLENLDENKINRFYIESIDEVPQDVFQQLKPGDVLYNDTFAYIAFYNEEDIAHWCFIEFFETRLVIIYYYFDDQDEEWLYGDDNSYNFGKQLLRNVGTVDNGKLYAVKNGNWAMAGLYKHTLTDNTGYQIIAITTESGKYSNLHFNSYAELYQRFLQDGLRVMYFKGNNPSDNFYNFAGFNGTYFYFIELDNTNHLAGYVMDDFGISSFVDSVQIVGYN